MTNFLTARWENIIMANYQVDPAVLKPYLPHGVELDVYEGKTFVSVVGFMFKDTRLFKIPMVGLGTFEEVNLRFYVIRREGNLVKRGVVFINETVPYKLVAWLANALYKEHYTVVPTRHRLSEQQGEKQVEYAWKVKGQWNSIAVRAQKNNQVMQSHSFEEFIFEHYYGYTKVSDLSTEEYKIQHPRWSTHHVLEYDIQCDFGEMYGKAFGFLNHSAPTRVLMAEGSPIAVKWERKRF
jgi:uncharacterized protein